MLLAWVGLALASGGLAFGFVELGVWQLSMAVWALLVLGIIAMWKHWSWAPSLLLIFYCVAAVIGVWREMWPGWALLGLLGGLAAADLMHFTWRLQAAMGIGGNLKQLNDRHYRRLGVVFGLGTTLYLVALLAQVRLNFSLALLLGLIAVLGIGLGLKTRGQSNG
jgi:hypothetical protein